MKPLSLLLPVFVLLTSGLTAFGDILQADGVQSVTAADAQVVNSQDRDIGTVAVAGSASNIGTGGFTMTASGEATFDDVTFTPLP